MSESDSKERDPNLTARYGMDPEAIKRGFANHLKYDLAEDHFTATHHDRYAALAWAVRDRLIKYWIQTQQAHHFQRAKRVYYLSMEFLMGRLLSNNVANLGIEESVRQAMQEQKLDWDSLCEEESDAGLGNGGLGRLAACFLDSMATLDIPAYGYGLRYDYGIFRQRLENGQQIEEPDDWLRFGNPWEIPRPDYRIEVNFGGRVETVKRGGKLTHHWVDTQPVIGIPYDVPIVGYRTNTVNTLRLWSARGAEEFDFSDFNQGDYIGAVTHKVQAENITKVLYPNDVMYVGKELRLRQQYFFVACSLFDILRRFKKDSDDWMELPDKVAIQLNDTHPALAVPELLRLLVDVEGIEWDEAWPLVVRCFGYTNHTLLPEALETWPVSMLERLLPRHLQIIYLINQQFLENVARRYPGDLGRLERMSLVQENPERRVRMAHLSMVGSHKTNGVAQLHTNLLKARVVPDFADMFPERFTNKTNGVTPRRWLMKCNPGLATLITEAIGEGWMRDLRKLTELRRFERDAAFLERWGAVKRQNKARLANYIRLNCGVDVNPDSIFDVQIKRIHEYKRQLLNVLHVVHLYRLIHENPRLEIPPVTFVFAGKAAPGYYMAKLIIKLINNIAKVVNGDLVTAGRIKVIFLPNYGVSLAERIIPAAELSEQISLAGKEASGTGNMKMMMNGALTIGTMDGANIEILEEVGAENIFIFGLTAEEVSETRANYDAHAIYAADPGLKATLDLAFGSTFCRDEPGIFDPLRDALLAHGDYYMHLADLPSYIETHERARQLHSRPAAWARKSLANVACSGKFSSDRTIAEYAREIWQCKAVHVREGGTSTDTITMARGDLSPRRPIAG